MILIEDIYLIELYIFQIYINLQKKKQKKKKKEILYLSREQNLLQVNYVSVLQCIIITIIIVTWFSYIYIYIS